MIPFLIVLTLLALVVAFRAGQAWANLDHDLEHLTITNRERHLAAEVWDDCVTELHGRADAIPNPYRAETRPYGDPS